MKTLAYRAMLVLLIPAFLLTLVDVALIEASIKTVDLWRKFWDEASHA